jgi:hypothetical protein
MLGFSAKLPVSDEDRQWVDDGFVRLEKLLGRRRLVESRVVLPTAEDFPDPYDNTPAAVENLFCRVCSYMHVARNCIELEIFSDEVEELREILPHWQERAGRKCAAGLFFDGTGEDKSAITKMVVAVKSTQTKDPLSLVATMAHELGHVILLGGKLMDPKSSDHEPMTDLLTVFLGLGVFTANSAARFSQYHDDRRQGWSMQRLGYLPEEVFGYALAKFAWERKDEAKWAKHLSTNVRSYFKRSHAWLAKHGPQLIEMPRPIG